MVLIPLDIIEKILEYQGSPFDSLLLPFLRRAILSTNVKFGSLLLFDRERNLVSMARFGEYEEEKIRISIREFFNRLKMCKSLFFLTMGKSIRYASSKAGYRFKSSFTKAFLKTFSIAPAYFLRKRNEIEKEEDKN